MLPRHYFITSSLTLANLLEEKHITYFSSSEGKQPLSLPKHGSAPNDTGRKRTLKEESQADTHVTIPKEESGGAARGKGTLHRREGGSNQPTSEYLEKKISRGFKPSRLLQRQPANTISTRFPSSFLHRSELIALGLKLRLP